MIAKPILGILLVVSLLGSQAAAGSYEDNVLEQLQAQGYGDIRVSRTLLGRARIVAVSGEFSREIILDRNTGEILRDLWFRAEQAAASGGGNDATSQTRTGAASGSSGTNNGGTVDGVAGTSLSTVAATSTGAGTGSLSVSTAATGSGGGGSAGTSVSTAATGSGEVGSAGTVTTTAVPGLAAPRAGLSVGAPTMPLFIPLIALD